MSISDRQIVQSSALAPARIFKASVVLISVAAAIPIFWRPLGHTWQAWMTSPEYNYGPIIPVIAGLMVWRDIRRSKVAAGNGTIGLGILLFALMCGVFGQMAAFVFLAQIGLLLFVVGLIVTTLGDRRALSVWPGIVYLAFSVPLAKLLQAALSAKLQLISSALGVLFIRAFHIPVFLEGNVIDLGTIQLQVAEACSGLRYLFPLASFSFLCAYLITAPRWQRAVIFLSALPIAIMLNCVRIGLTGILADYFGIEAATGFFHDFEGWLVFCACITILFLEMKLLCYAGGSERSLLKRLDFTWPARVGIKGASSNLGRWPASIAAAMTLLGLAVFLSVSNAGNIIPPRPDFSTFPREIGAWRAAEAPVDQQSLDVLKSTDNLSLNFSNDKGSLINVWVAYYDSQEIGEAIHSPQICLPGGGWGITNASTVPIGVGDGLANRVIIQQRGVKQLVYYWFQGRGRIETSEYAAKIELMTDAILRHRTDGALVRFVVPIDDAGVASAETKMKSFIAQAQPLLGPYLPD